MLRAGGPVAWFRVDSISCSSAFGGLSVALAGSVHITVMNAGYDFALAFSFNARKMIEQILELVMDVWNWIWEGKPVPPVDLRRWGLAAKTTGTVTPDLAERREEVDRAPGLGAAGRALGHRC